jgi:hypothetical protein
MQTQPTVAVQVVSAEQAMLWLSNSKYDHQRNLKPDHVSFLAEEMRQEAFKQDTVIEFCSVNSSEWLTDGQHRLAAVVTSGIPQRFVVVRRAMLDDEAVAVDYTRTDKGRPRTIAEDYKTLDLSGELGLTNTQIEKLGAAVQFVNAGFYSGRTLKMHSKPRLALMREYADAAERFFEDAEGAVQTLRHRLDRRATLSVALVTYRYSTSEFGELVSRFWRGMIEDDGLRSTDPRKHALRHINDAGMSGGAAVGRAVTPTYSSRYIAKCFNLFVSGETIKFVKIVDPTQPILILGSPFTGKA